MRITISGVAGSGKSTIAKLLARELNLEHYSTGDLMREIAKKKNVSLLKLSRMAEHDKSIDEELDKRQIRLGKEKDNFVIDGRLSAYFIPHADVKIFLECDDEERAKRIMKDKREGEESGDIEDMMKKIKEREESERKRYKKYYGYDYRNKDNYDHVIDTTNSEIGDVLKDALNIVNKNTKHL
jgi:cytidylate kinase